MPPTVETAGDEATDATKSANNFPHMPKQGAATAAPCFYANFSLSLQEQLQCGGDAVAIVG
jgi:hypothetical protein